MVLNMADFLDSWKSFETLGNASKTVLKLFANASETVCVDLGLIRKRRKLADFEQKAWPIAHGFEDDRFFELLEIVRNSLKCLQNRSKMICDCFRDCLCRFRVNSQKSKIGRFWANGLGYSPWFWTWPIFWTPGNRSKLYETPPKPFQKGFVTASATVCVDLGWIRKNLKLADFEQRAWATAHGFEHGRFWQVLEIVPNSLKRLQNRSKMICEYLGDCLCRVNVNSEVSKIGRFLTKGL